jgi:DNA mismatch endonuclease (patch repair protein)
LRARRFRIADQRSRGTARYCAGVMLQVEELSERDTVEGRPVCEPLFFMAATSRHRPTTTSLQRSALMRRVRQSNTDCERAVRSVLHALGARFRVNVRGLPGTPDIANRSRRWAVFVHGCFWHGHLNCRLATVPKSNSSFWEEKLVANRERDMRKVVQLRRLGFTVLTVWQCEIQEATALRSRLRRIVRLPVR